MTDSITVFVTGGAGYIGSFTTKSLLDAGHKVIVYDNFTTGFRESVDSRAHLIEGDIRDSAKLDRIFSDNKIGAIIHFAAKTVVPDSIKFPLEYYDNNFAGSLNLLECATKARIDKFIFSSTAAVYAPSPTGCVNEESPTAPLTPYGTSKLFFENALRDVRMSRPLSYVVLRYFNVAGAALDASNGQRTKGATHLIKVAAEVACGKRNLIEIYGDRYPTPDGTTIRDYIHVEDLAAAHVLALQYVQNNSCGEIFNCGYGKGTSVKEVVACIEKQAGRPIEKKMSPPREGDPVQVFADSAKIRSAMGWKPKYADLDVICKTAYEWEKRLPK